MYVIPHAIPRFLVIRLWFWRKVSPKFPLSLVIVEKMLQVGIPGLLAILQNWAPNSNVSPVESC
jgi:hypothetical protein